MTTRTPLYRSDGAPVTLDTVLGRGGEGEVRVVQHHPELVAKIYNQRPTRDRIDKLLAMVALADPAITKIVAWPIATLHERAGGDVVGFLMPKVGDRLELHKLTHPMDRLRHFPDVGYDFLVHVATNLARAFNVLHTRGIIVGDVNESGIMVGRDGTVMLIDSDSMQLSHGGRRFTCDVGKPELQPPEVLAHASFRGLVRTVEHDAFGLGVLVFQLLFLGWHPFNVKMLVGDQEPLPDNIKKGRFAHALGFRASTYTKPPNALDAAVLPDDVRDLFERTFVPGRARPAAEAWIGALGRFQRESTTCTRFGTHSYHASLPRCPLCELDARLGFPVLPHIALDAAQLRGLWGAIQGAWFELGTPATEPSTPRVPPDAVAPEITAHARRVVAARWAQLGVVATGTGLLALSPWLGLVALAAAPIELALQLAAPRAWRQARADRAQRRAALARARAALLAGADDAVVHNFEAAAAAYGRIIRFEATRDKALADITERAFPEQMRRFLAGVRVQSGAIPGIGTRQVRLLAAAGVTSAADLLAGVPEIDGLGAAERERLADWVEYQKTRFMPDLQDERLVERLARANIELDAQYAQLVEELKLSHAWLGERVPLERRRRLDALDAYDEAALAMARAARLDRALAARLRKAWD